MQPALTNYKKCVIKVTDYCPMNCSYCFSTGVGVTTYKKNIFSYTKEFCDFWQKYSLDPKEYVFHFFGGEPLLEFDTVVRPIVSFLRSRSWKIRIKITTNGLLLTPRILEFFNTYHVMTIISIDGPRRIFDINRDTHNSGIYSQVIENYSYISRLPRTLPETFFFGLSSTFNTKTIQDISKVYRWVNNELEPRPRFWHWNIDFTNSNYTVKEFDSLCRQIRHIYLQYIISKKQVKDLYLNKVMNNQLFTYFPGLAFGASGNIVFGGGEDEIDKDVKRVHLGSLQTTFDKEKYLSLYQENIAKAFNYQYCAPRPRELCALCQHKKDNNLIISLQKQQFLCFLQNLRSETNDLLSISDIS